MTFYESTTNESGSILPDHVNAIRDEVTSYEVRTLTPIALLDHLGLDSADILKLDIEGAEYELLQSISADELVPFRQIFIEFHHHMPCIAIPKSTPGASSRGCAASATPATPSTITTTCFSVARPDPLLRRHGRASPAALRRIPSFSSRDG